MRKLLAALAAVAFGALVLSSGSVAHRSARSAGGRQWEVVVMHVHNRARVERCLSKAGSDYTYEEEEVAPGQGSSTEVVKDEEYSSKAKAKRALRKAPHCAGPHRGIEREEAGG